MKKKIDIVSVHAKRDLAISKTIKKGQKLFLITNGKRGDALHLSLMPEEIFNKLRRHGIETGRNPKVICEMVFDGNHLAITQFLESMVLQK